MNHFSLAKKDCTTRQCSSKQFSNKDGIKDNSKESTKARDLKFSKQDHPFLE